MLRLLLFLAFLAAVLYAVFWLLDRRSRGRRPGGGGSARPVPRGPVGPDDDEDFLRELERKRRKASRDAGAAPKPPPAPPRAQEPAPEPPAPADDPAPEQPDEAPRRDDGAATS